MLSNRPKVLVVAGLDSGGGAGISADCITVYDNGAFALPTVSALTCQSLKSVYAVENSSNELFAQCLNTALNDWDKISAVKIGLVCKKDHLDILLDFLSNKLKDTPVVWDPVLTATAGRLDSADLKSNLKAILSVTTIFTPNLPEALELANWSMDDLKEKGINQLCQYFLDMGLKNIIIKGGHRQECDEAVDVFASDNLSFTMSYGKKAGDGAHGGGCALSSALAALLAQGYAAFDAAVLAKAYITKGIFQSAVIDNEYRPPIGHHGFVDNIDFCPYVKEEGFPTSAYNFKRVVDKLGLYPVCDNLEFLAQLLKLGVRTAQLRIKDSEDKNLYLKIMQAVELGREYGARIFINDHYKLAAKAGAYGVHLGMEDLRDADLEFIYKHNLALGISTHGPYELLKAYQLNPSYIAIGHIFETKSKIMPSKPQGLDKLQRQVTLLQGKVPLTCIGGIKLEHLESIAKTNIGSIALITALSDIKDNELLKQAVDKWIEVIGNGQDESL